MKKWYLLVIVTALGILLICYFFAGKGSDHNTGTNTVSISGKDVAADDTEVKLPDDAVDADSASQTQELAESEDEILPNDEKAGSAGLSNDQNEHESASDDDHGSEIKELEIKDDAVIYIDENQAVGGM